MDGHDRKRGPRWSLVLTIGLAPVWLAALGCVAFFVWLLVTGGAHGFLR
jgi:hypothetical protein